MYINYYNDTFFQEKGRKGQSIPLTIETGLAIIEEWGRLYFREHFTSPADVESYFFGGEIDYSKLWNEILWRYGYEKGREHHENKKTWD